MRVKRSPIENSNSWPNRIISSNIQHGLYNTNQITRRTSRLFRPVNLWPMPARWMVISIAHTPWRITALVRDCRPRSLTDRPSHTLELIGAQTGCKSLLVTWSLEWSTPVFVSRSASCGRITQSGCSELCYLIRPLARPGPRDPYWSDCSFEIVYLSLKPLKERCFYHV